MELFWFYISLIILCCACSSESPSSVPLDQAFDHKLWSQKNGKDYLFREFVIKDIMKSDTLRNLSKSKILELLGEPDIERNHKDYLYYIISQKRFLSWTIHTKTLVIKFSDLNTVEWIKIHE